MSTDMLSQKITEKIEWHRSEIARLERDLEAHQRLMSEFGSPGQYSLPTATYTQPDIVIAGPGVGKTMMTVKGLSFVEAVRRVIRDGETVDAKEIARRLFAAGYESEAMDKVATIYNQLDQYARKGAGIIKIGDRRTGVLWRRM